jgi:hypothetical protein
VQPRDQVARQERAIARYADDPGDIRPVRRNPIEPRPERRERSCEIRHAVGDDRQSELPQSAPDRRSR